MQDALTEVSEVYPEIRIVLYVDEIEIHTRAKHMKSVEEVPQMFFYLTFRLVGTVSREQSCKQGRRLWDGWND